MTHTHSKAKIITYSECICVSVDVVMQHEMRMRRVIRGLSRSTLILRII